MKEISSGNQGKSHCTELCVKGLTMSVATIKHVRNQMFKKLPIK